MTLGNSKILVEVCVDSVGSAMAAERGGASRVELCSSQLEGGVTPSAGLIEKTRASVSLPVHVMIRPRGGDFCYDGYEFETMQRDIELAKSLRADGVVLGILTIEGRVNIPQTQELARLARPLAVTFHRAFDMTADLFQALEDLCSVGVNRVLTSGAEQTCLLGSRTIAQLVEKSQGRIVVMPGSGIKPENARRLVVETGANEIHVGLRTALPSPMQYRNPRVSMGSAKDKEYERSQVLESDVRKLCTALAQG